MASEFDGGWWQIWWWSRVLLYFLFVHELQIEWPIAKRKWNMIICNNNEWIYSTCIWQKACDIFDKPQTTHGLSELRNHLERHSWGVYFGYVDSTKINVETILPIHGLIIIHTSWFQNTYHLSTELWITVFRPHPYGYNAQSLHELHNLNWSEFDFKNS